MKKNILVAVSGGIAAYKACDLVSKLARIHNVTVMMTPNAMEFVNPVTFAALSHNTVYHSEFHSETPIPHIDLAKWADLLIVAPASADVIAKAVHGIADNLVTSTFLACTCPKILCPAMNEHMLENAVTQRNIALAKELGWHVLDPAVGHLACMDQGKGRLPDTPTMIACIEQLVSETNSRKTEEKESKAAQTAQSFSKSDPNNFAVLEEEALSAQGISPSEPGHLPEAGSSNAGHTGDFSKVDPVRLHQQILHNPLTSAGSLQLQNRRTSAAEAHPDPDSLPDPLGSSDAGGAEENQILYDDALAEIKPLKGKHVLISAGPTQEALDPVRFITNHSSGKQGYAIAEDARDWGAQVILVSGPVNIAPPKGVELISVTNAREMEAAMQAHADWADFIIMAAAVADYRPKTVADQKIKKSDENMVVEFVKNPDILKSLSARKKSHQVLCGFAMETQNLDANARAKLESKNCDMLIANNLTTKGAGFQNDTNVVSLLKPDSIEHLPLQSKKQLGYTILADMIEIAKGKTI